MSGASGYVGGVLMRGATTSELIQAGKPIRQRAAGEVRHCAACGTQLARDNFGSYCSPCWERASRHQEMGYDLETLMDEAVAEEPIRDRLITPRTGPTQLAALIKERYGSIRSGSWAIGYAISTLYNWTSADRRWRGHALIPQDVCDRLNEALNEGR